MGLVGALVAASVVDDEKKEVGGETLLESADRRLGWVMCAVVGASRSLEVRLGQQVEVRWDGQVVLGVHAFQSWTLVEALGVGLKAPTMRVLVRGGLLVWTGSETPVVR